MHALPERSLLDQVRLATIEIPKLLLDVLRNPNGVPLSQKMIRRFNRMPKLERLEIFASPSSRSVVDFNDLLVILRELQSRTTTEVLVCRLGHEKVIASDMRRWQAVLASIGGRDR